MITRKRFQTILSGCLAFVILTAGCSIFDPPPDPDPDPVVFRLGCEVFLEEYKELVSGKRVGLVTNQTGVLSTGEDLISVMADDPDIHLVALYGPEHGIDGKAKAGEYVESYTHPELGIPVYSLYGATRKPTEAMLEGIDVLIFDIQDIGSRTYTYMSTMNYCMDACRRDGLPMIVLDRPNPVGGMIVEGPVLEDRFKTFVGVDNLPMAHGMTAGELARFYNRIIGADVTVIPMSGYTRDMIYQDTGLEFVGTSPSIQTIQSAFGYMATGLGEGTRVGQQDQFTWIGGTGIDSQQFADLLNNAGLPGVQYIPEPKGSSGGVRLEIYDYRSFNPALSGFYALIYAKQLKDDFVVPKSTDTTIVMFDKVMGTDRFGQWLEQGLSPQQVVTAYQDELNDFKNLRKQYLIYDLTMKNIPPVHS